MSPAGVTFPAAPAQRLIARVLHDETVQTVRVYPRSEPVTQNFLYMAHFSRRVCGSCLWHVAQAQF
jgi:hypothetical protein